MQRRLTKLQFTILPLLCLFWLSARPPALPFKGTGLDPGDNLDRAQTLIFNLNRVEGSPGWFLLQSIKHCRETNSDLVKAIHQVQGADKTYARLRGVPDNQFMDITALKIEKALKTNELMEADLKDAYTELKSQIEEILITDEERKKAHH